MAGTCYNLFKKKEFQVLGIGDQLLWVAEKKCSLVSSKQVAEQI